VETVGSTQTGPVGTAGPLKARDTVTFDRRMALGVQRPLTGRPGLKERSLTSGPAPI
jgi:hypothetical protein